MLKTIVALFSGALFGVGLIVSGMADLGKVIGFLDFAGDWDPTLAFVMGGALLVTGPMFRLILKHPRPVLASGFALPTKSAVDSRLVGGAALFGAGWGLSGFCPGPAVAALSTGLTPVLAFVASMLVGMAVYAWAFDRSDSLRRSPAAEATALGGSKGSAWGAVRSGRVTGPYVGRTPGRRDRPRSCPPGIMVKYALCRSNRRAGSLDR